MASKIVSGVPIKQKEPRQDQEYEVLPLQSTKDPLSVPAIVTIDYIPNTKSVTDHAGVKETVVHIKIADLNSIRLPMDANPRKPEHIQSIVDTLRESAQEANPNLFVYKNNGIDIFCKKLSEPIENELQIEFGNADARDGICNGGLTYYCLQSLSSLTNDACVKVRFYEFGGADLELKAKIAKAKNQNRSVASTDDANFMGYFDRIKERLGDYVNFVKWETGDVSLQTEYPMTIGTLIRFLSTLRIDDPYHWEINPNQHTFTSHKTKTSLLTQSGKYIEDFIETMRGED